MINKVIKIEDKEIPIASSAQLVIIYSELFGSDIFIDLQNISQAIKTFDSNVLVTKILSQFAYCLAKQANPKIEEFNTWLGQFSSPISIINSAEQLFAIWDLNMQPQVKSKKK